MIKKHKNLNYKKFFSVPYKSMNIYRSVCTTIFLLIFISLYVFTLFFTGISFKTNISDWIEYNTLLRTTSALLVGFGLAVAGCGMQGVTRNELSGPTTLGLLPAASLGIIIAEAFKLKEIYYVFIFGFIISFIAIGINFISLKIRAYNTNNFKSVLIGLILGALLSSIALIITTIFPYISEKVNFWIGSTSTNNYTWERFSYAAPFIVLGSIMIFSMQNKLNIIEKDISIAITLGINVKMVYWVIGTATILISISSVLLLGSIAIIGIVIPHVCRMLLKTKDYRWIMSVSGLMSATILMFAVLMDVMFQFGISLFTVITFVPIFILIMFKKKVAE